MRLPNVAKQQSLQQAQAERRILVWQQNERLPFLGGLLFFGKLLDSNPPNRGPRKFPICGESEDVQLPNVAKQQSSQQAQSERRILVWQQNPLENHHIFA